MHCSTRLTTILLIAVVLLASCQVDDSTTDNDSVTAAKVASLPEITVYKTPTCGCCAEWVTYLKDEGFNVTAIDHDDLDPIRAELGLSDPKLQSCHTAVVDGYIVEGHVPANDIKRLLREKPQHIKGITAPGMPMMSPGMASRTPKDYDVLSFSESGVTKIYSKY